MQHCGSTSNTQACSGRPGPQGRALMPRMPLAWPRLSSQASPQCDQGCPGVRAPFFSCVSNWAFLCAAAGHSDSCVATDCA